MNKANTMKLFIINNVLSDYTYSMVAIKAETLAETCKFYVERFYDGSNGSKEGRFFEFAVAITNKDYIVMDLADTDQTPAGFVTVMFGDVRDQWTLI